MKSLKATAYEMIKGRIVNCEFKPFEFLDLSAISQELGISRTPVRDAITQLEQEELVTVIPRHGVMVTGISIKKIIDISRTRVLIEPATARAAVGTADEKVLRRFKTRFSRLADQRDLFEADMEFHSYLVRLTDNDYVIQMMSRLLYDNYRLIQLAAGIPERLGDSNAEHIAIIDAILDGDPDQAEEMMRAHLRQAESSSIEGSSSLPRYV